MGASSVTGVSGPGSVDGLSKGSQQMSLGVGKLIGPHVVQAGNVALVSGTYTVTFADPLPSVMVAGVAVGNQGYSVVATAQAGTNPTIVPTADNSSNQFVGFTITGGTGSDRVCYQVSTIGNGYVV